MPIRSLISRSLFTLIVLTAIAAPAQANSLAVPRDYPTIQAAVDAAAPGDTVRVGPGVFTEELVIKKDLQLRGAGIAATAVKAPPLLHSYGVHLPDGRGLTAIVRVAGGAHVRMSDLTVRGPIPCGIEVSGVHVLQGATLDFFAARVTGIQADPTTCAPSDAAGRAVVYGTPSHILVDGQYGTTAYGRIIGVQIDHYQHAGLSIAGPREGVRSRVTATDDVITGGWEIPTFQVGAWISDGAVAHMTHNTVIDNVCGGPGCGPDPINEGQGIGIFLLSLPPGTRVAGNQLAGNDTAINQILSPGCCSIAGNRLVDNHWFGVAIQDGDGTTSGNSISGGQTGIAVIADSTDTTGVLRGDRIRGTSLAPVREIECCGYTANAIVRGDR